MNLFFKSKVDRYVIFRSLLIMMIPFVILYFNGITASKILLLVWIFEGIVIVPFAILRPLLTIYKLTQEGVLIVPAGFRKIKINVKTIASIKSENSIEKFIIYSYINSLDQIKLVYKKNREITISPNNKEEFVRVLKKWNPRIVAEISTP